MEKTEIKNVIETLLFVTDQPISSSIIKNVLGTEAAGYDIEALINEISQAYLDNKSPIELRFIGGGWQFSTAKEYAPWIRKLYKEKTTLRLSPSALETLSVIAYKQPITRSEIAEIRGVETTGVLETLLERKLVKIVGRKETVGRPMLYGTSQEFLKHFGLGHLSELPNIDELSAPSGNSGEDNPSQGEFALSDESQESLPVYEGEEGAVETDSDELADVDSTDEIVLNESKENTPVSISEENNNKSASDESSAPTEEKIIEN